MKTRHHQEDDGGKRSREPLLPAFYPQFDPAKIPDVDDNMNEEDRGAIRNAFISLKAMIFLVIGPGFPEAVAVAFWPRLWKWIEFLWLYPDLVPAELHHDMGPLSPYGAVCVCFAHLPQVATIINATPGVWMVLAQHWEELLQSLDHDSHVDLFVCVCECVERINQGITHDTHFQDVVDGAGGTLDDLASVVAGHTRFIIRFFHLPIPDAIAIRLLRCALTLIVRAKEADASIVGALLRHGIVEGLVSLYCRIAGSTAPFPSPLEELLFFVLRGMLVFPPGYPWITQALKAGILHAILLAGRKAYLDRTELKYLLRTVLPNAMVYHSVLSQLQVSLEEYNVTQATDNLRPDVCDEYIRLLGLAGEQIGLKEWYDSTEYISHKACDNMDCGKISNKQDFRCCDGCRQAHYCSRECQIADWKTPNGHRARCVRLRSAPSTYLYPGGVIKPPPGLPSHLSRRNASFLRALVHHDYIRERHNIRMQQILQDFRSLRLSYVEPEMEGCLSVGGDPLLDAGNSQPGSDTKEEDCCARAERGGGRFELHRVLVAEGSSIRMHIIPMHSSDSAVSDGLKRLKYHIPAGTNMQQLRERFPHICEELDALLKMEIVEIH